MKDFNFYAPTRVVFGRNAEKQIGQLVKANGGHKVLIHYGGGSAERSGLLGVVRQQLQDAGISFVELGGVVPNPLLSLVYQGIELCRREQVDFCWLWAAARSSTPPRPSATAYPTTATCGTSGLARPFLRSVCPSVRC